MGVGLKIEEKTRSLGHKDHALGPFMEDNNPPKRKRIKHRSIKPQKQKQNKMCFGKAISMCKVRGRVVENMSFLLQFPFWFAKQTTREKKHTTNRVSAMFEQACSSEKEPVTYWKTLGNKKQDPFSDIMFFFFLSYK